jgi:hypothetical protein
VSILLQIKKVGLHKNLMWVHSTPAAYTGIQMKTPLAKKVKYRATQERESQHFAVQCEK